MTINSQSGTSLLDSVLQAQSSREDANVALLKKAQDVEKQQGAAVIDMLEQSVPNLSQSRLDTYA